MRSERISHWPWSLVLTVAVLLASSSASAQSAWRETYAGGQQILTFTTPTLTPGKWYEIETDAGVAAGGSFAADTVMTLRRSLLGTTDSITGSDGCDRTGHVELNDSCFLFYMDPANYPTARTFTIVVRAYSPVTAGLTTLRIQESNASRAVTPGACTPQLPVRTGCWSEWTNLTFGGIVRSGLGTGTSATRAHFETREQPGATGVGAPHILWFIPYNNNQTGNWLIEFNYSSNHRTMVGGTAEFQGFLPGNNTYTGSTLLGGPLYFNEPLEMMRNDYGVDGTTTFGTDYDGDELGPNLENLFLTCDSTLSPTVNGVACTSLQTCSSAPSGAVCRAALRDTDQDGYEDRLEVYGYRNGIDSQTNMARFGANPARYDIFVEADAGNESPQLPNPSCIYSDFSLIDAREAAQMVSVYANATAAQVPNRSGQTGIGLHIDIPIPPSGTLNPPPPADSPSFGYWGGATCVRTPECTSNANCTFLGEPGVCSSPPASGPRYCSEYSSAGAWEANHRRWLFRHVMVYKGGSGRAGVCSMMGVAGGAQETPHEISHMGCIGHGGPQGSRAPDEWNNRTNWFSRTNYLYDYYGFADTEGANEPLDPTRLGQVSFGRGTSIALNPNAAIEACPLASTQPTQVFTESTDFQVNTAACAGVDWDFDGTFQAAAQPVPGMLWPVDERRIKRGVASRRWLAIDSAQEITASATVLRVFRNEALTPSTSSVGTLTVSRATAFTCNNTPNPTGNRFPLCDIENGSAAVPVTLSGGVTINTPTFAVTDVITPTATAESLIVWRSGTSLSWARLPDSTTTGAVSSSGTVTGSTPRTTADGTELLALARVNGAGATLIYRNPSGQLVEQVMTWTGSPAVPSWAAPTVLPAAMQTGLQGSPGITTAYGISLVSGGLVLALQQSSNTVNVYTRGPSTAWGLATSVAGPGAIRGAPRPEVGPSRTRVGVTGNYLYINARFPTSTAILQRRSTFNSLSFPTTGTGWIDWTRYRGFEHEAAATGAMRRDTRSPAGIRGVHAELYLAPRCASSAACGAGGTCFFVSGITDGWCFTGSASQGVVDCGPSGTNGACPAGNSCRDLGIGVSYCARGGVYLPMDAYAAPAADGIVPGVMEDFNDWSEFRFGYCSTLRHQRHLAPTEYMTPVPSNDAWSTCVTEPTW